MLPAQFRNYRPKMNAIFEALACPTRRKVLEQVALRVVSPAEIAAVIGVSPPTVIYHIRKLREAGLVEPYFGPSNDYIDHEAVEALRYYFDKYLGSG